MGKSVNRPRLGGLDVTLISFWMDRPVHPFNAGNKIENRQASLIGDILGKGRQGCAFK